jgi:hypothetical protein
VARVWRGQSSQSSSPGILGARVIPTAKRGPITTIVRGLGADQIIDYNRAGLFTFTAGDIRPSAMRWLRPPSAAKVATRSVSQCGGREAAHAFIGSGNTAPPSHRAPISRRGCVPKGRARSRASGSGLPPLVTTGRGLRVPEITTYSCPKPRPLTAGLRRPHLRGKLVFQGALT